MSTRSIVKRPEGGLLWRPLIAVVVGALILAGCSGSAESADGSISVGLPTAVPQLNPAIRTFAAEEVLFPLLWNALTKVGPDGSIEPDLAQSWDSSDDLQTWTFSLRTGVEFNDGSPFTAQDVVDTFEYYLSPDTVTQEAGKIASIESVTALDESTVEFRLDTPSAVFPAAIVYVKMLKVDTLSDIDRNPVGTGPYVLDDFVPDNSVTLKANPNYWGDPPAIETIEIVGMPTAAAMTQALLSGDLDVAWNVAKSDAESISESGAAEIVDPSSQAQYQNWEFDMTAPPFNDVRVRQAFAYALDRERILRDAFYGLGTVSMTNNPIADASPWFSDEGATVYEYDLEKAAQLFEEAGIAEGTTFTWWGVAGQYPEWNTSAQILQASLAEIGMNLEIVNNELGTWAEKFYPAGKSFPNMIVPNLQPRPAEPAYALAFYLSGECQCNWNSDEFDAAYSTALAVADEDERRAAWAEAQLMINQQVPELIPLQMVTTAAASTELTGVWQEPGGQIHVEDARFSD